MEALFIMKLVRVSLRTLRTHSRAEDRVAHGPVTSFLDGRPGEARCLGGGGNKGALIMKERGGRYEEELGNLCRLGAVVR